MNFSSSARWSTLVARGALLRRLRYFFEKRAFVEVETPSLSQDVVVDRHIDPLSTTLFADPREPHAGPKYWLQTSPEFCLKRLLVSAAEESSDGQLALFQVAKAFRGGESGRLHNPEFTLVEWYRVGDGYEAGMQLLGELAAELLGRGPPERINWRDAFRQHANVDPLVASITELQSAAHALGSSVELDFAADRAALVDLLLVKLVEPQLGFGRPTILYDYPADQAALAKVRPGRTADEPAVAERFELYVDGIEIANGYHELLDANVLRQRNQVQNEWRQRDQKFTLPTESRLLAAMEKGLPACSGCALGFDRLAMIALGKSSIADVIAFPIERA